MTLHLLGPLRWESQGRQPQLLPVVLPVAILLVLARHGQWLSRAQVTQLFWPEFSGEAALLNLRVNLHKARRLLEELGIGVPIQSERRNIRWSPPTDLGADTDTKGPLASNFELPEFEAFDSWLREWREACAGPQLRTSARGIAADDEHEPEMLAMPAGGFYGRRVELARLRSSNTPALVVAGEAGVGKSRLVAEAFESAPWLRCREALRQISFGAVADLFQSHPQWLQDLGAYRLDVARLLPDIAPDEPLPPLDALTARVRLFEGLARAVEQHVALLAVDDLQWADPATVEWLVMLAHRGRMRWVATARSEELPAHASSALQALEAAGAARVIALQGLDRTALNTLLHDRRPDLAGAQSFPRPHAWLDALWSYTEGNAFCAIEVMEALTPDDVAQRLAQMPLPQRVARMVRRRRDRLAAPARAVVDAAALAIGRPSLAQLAAAAGLDIAATMAALHSAQRHGLMHDTACRHDLVRQALRDGIAPAHAAELHRRFALHLAGEDAEPELIAYHWRSAGDDESAWPFVLRAAQRLKQRGERDAAVAALSELREAARDETLALRAEVALAQEHLFDDLAAGRRALESTLVRAACLPAGIARQTIEAEALACLVENAVFSGEMARAIALAPELRAKMPGLPSDALVEVHQMLIEATMREGDFEAARASLDGLRQAGAARAVVLSFEAQIHWFSGAVREARQVFEHLLARHPDYCRGLTIESDLAVMCQALGDLGTAEELSQRSLRSWAGNAHTEALSWLVLGTTLTSRGRFAEALQALERAHSLGRQQGSGLFVAEALARRARMHWCAAEMPAARRAALEARAQAGAVVEPLRASGLALMELLTSIETQAAPDRDALAALALLGASSRHPVVQARHWRAQAAAAAWQGDKAEALAAARRLAAVARHAELLEWLCEALALVALFDRAKAADTARGEALALAHSQGFGWLVARLDGKAAPARRTA